MARLRVPPSINYERALWGSHLSGSTLLVGLCFAHYSRDRLNVQASYSDIQAATGLARSTVALATRQLVTDGWLTLMEAPRRYDPPVYSLTWPS